MKEFSLTKYHQSLWVNKGRGKKLTKKEKEVWELFRQVEEGLKRGEIIEGSKSEGEGFFDWGVNKKYNYFYALYCPKVNAGPKHHKDIKFVLGIDEIGDRYVELIREYCGLGNGSYYIFDRETERVIYKEDD